MTDKQDELEAVAYRYKIHDIAGKEVWTLNGPRVALETQALCSLNEARSLLAARDAEIEKFRAASVALWERIDQLRTELAAAKEEAAQAVALNEKLVHYFSGVERHFSSHLPSSVFAACVAAQQVKSREALNAAIAAAVEPLKRELEAKSKDAERYQWLRGGKDVPPESTRWPRWEIRYWNGRHWNLLFAEQVDAGIDAAIAASKEEGKS